MSGLRDKRVFPGIRIEQRGDPCYNHPTRVYFEGITYREEVAKEVLAGFGRYGGESPEFLATIALARADALIAALEGPAATPGTKPARAIDVPCPECHAPPGVGCRDATSPEHPAGRGHVARALAFAAEYEPDPPTPPGPTPAPGLIPTSAALKIECSYCHAAPVEPCRDPGRRALPPATVHVARVPTLYGTWAQTKK